MLPTTIRPGRMAAPISSTAVVPTGDDRGIYGNHLAGSALI
jgi:hypothetical protein